MTAITEPGSQSLPEPFDFDLIDIETVAKMNCPHYGDVSVLRHCFKPTGKQEVIINFWREDSLIACADLARRYKEKALAPNPWELIAFALTQPDFADERSLATQWQDGSGGFCHAVFDRCDGKRSLFIGRASDFGWDAGNDFLFSGLFYPD